MPSLSPSTVAEVILDAFGTDMIVSVDEEDFTAEGLLSLRSQARDLLEDAVYLNEMHILDGSAGRPAKRPRAAH